MTVDIDNLQKRYADERIKAKERKEQLEAELSNVEDVIERLNGAIAALNELKQAQAQQATPEA